ncbi:MAG: hypothetical protein QOK12_4199, partial [Mycobacterium sp.]|nr:hypothetical protein [Mycobacterium sp.]
VVSQLGDVALEELDRTEPTLRGGPAKISLR